MTGTMEMSGGNMIYEWLDHYSKGDEAKMRETHLKLYDSKTIMDEKYQELKNRINKELQKHANEYVCNIHTVKVDKTIMVEDEAEKQTKEMLRKIRVPQKISNKKLVYQF